MDSGGLPKNCQTIVKISQIGNFEGHSETLFEKSSKNILGRLKLLNKLKNNNTGGDADSENKLDVVISGATAVDAEDPKEESESNATPTILPLVVKRMRRRLTALQHLSAGIGRIVHYVVAVNHVEDGDE